MVRAAFFTLAVLLVSVAPTQIRLGGRGQSADLLETGAGFLMMPPVQKEIGLSAATSKKITDKYMAFLGQFRGATNPGSGQPPKVNLQEVMKKTAQTQKEALTLLTPAQKARLKQITIQMLGASAFLNPEVKKGLALTDDQTRRISAIVQDGSMQMFKSMSVSGTKPTSDPAETIRRSAEFAKKQEEWKVKMLKESTKNFKPDQLAKWKAMQGKPFKLDMAAMMRSMPRGMGSAPRKAGG